MNFKQIFEEMKAGKKFKRKMWGGYWYWDDEKETIMMHTKEGEELDIRESERVAYTINNMLEDDWIEADNINCPELGGKLLFDFGAAIGYAIKGCKVRRENWKENMVLVHGKPNGVEERERLFCQKGEEVLEYIAVSDDIITEDWQFAE